MKRLLCLMATMVLVSAAWGYVFITNPSSGQPIKWPAGPIAMKIKTDNITVLSDGTTRATSIQAAVQDATRGWNHYLGTVQLSPQIVAVGDGADGNAINEIFFSITVYGANWDSNTLAITTAWYYSNQRTEGDILFNPTYTWDSYRGASRVTSANGPYDIQRVALHELGHVLGLDHPDENGQSVTALMNSIIGDIDSLQPDDINGAQALYGAPASAPSITSQPANQTVNAGQSAQFTVAASGNPAPTYQWQRLPAGSGTWANISDGGAYSGTSTTTLSITTATGMSGDQFRCVATNSAGSATSSPASLTVIAAVLPVISGLPATVTLNYGDTLSLSPTVTGTQPISYQWKIGGVNVGGATSSSYIKSNTTPADNGVYTLTATNGAGPVTSSNVTVTVNPAVAPVISGLPATVTLNYGDTLNLSASVTGTAPITYQWKQGGANIAGATSSSYIKSNATMADSGGYPFFIQVYGDALWTGSTGETITMLDVRRMRPRILATLDAGFFRARYVRASPHERLLMRDIAKFGESATIEQMQQASGKRNNEIQPTVSALIQKGLVYRPERARIAFTAPMFGAFLLRTPN